jgi:hypothetical protein
LHSEELPLLLLLLAAAVVVVVADRSNDRETSGQEASRGHSV